MTTPQRPTRVAILGGGSGAISAAFWLTSTPELRRRFQVSVYTHGWRLGGKGASGRDLRDHDRILEHGLHMWMGWYETAFRTIQECYSQLPKRPDHPFQTWRDAFSPQRRITLTECDAQTRGGSQDRWTLDFPRLPGTPGERPSRFGEASIHRLLGWLQGNMGPLINLPSHLTLTALRSWFRSWGEASIRRLYTNGYWLCALLDIGLAAATGYLIDVLPHGEAGFARINDLEFKGWLLSHGASPKYIWSPPIRALYDLGFAYENGDTSCDKAKAAAGVALRIMLQATVGYRDAPLWKMNAGMGDSVFAPLYEVLRARGVAINFFHRVSNLRLSQDGKSVQSIEFDRQVNLVARDYQPLVEIKGLPCWPSEPLWPQIAGGKIPRAAGLNLESSLCGQTVGKCYRESGRDFDAVVLAIPPAGLALFGAELLSRSERIATMYSAMSWVATRSVQMWFRKNVSAMGWMEGPTVLTGLVNPYNSWAEMSHLIARESWNREGPGSCEYFCGTMPAKKTDYDGRTSGRREADQIRKEFLAWADGSVSRFLPGAIRPADGLDRAQIISEYYRVNSDPSDMYVQSFPGSISRRLQSDESGIANLYLAGDWTATRTNSGCVEAAFESGKKAAEVIANSADCGLPTS